MKDFGMTTVNEPAFSVPQSARYEGMTLRDYFAAKAMQALLCDTGTKIGDHTAKISYAMADAMLKARK